MNYTITLARPITAADRVTITIAGFSIATYTRRLDILPGDLSDDGVVNNKDVKGVRNQFKHKGGTTSTIFGDILGDGTVDAKDNKAEGRLVGKKLPKLGGKVPKAELARALARRHRHQTSGQFSQKTLVPAAEFAETTERSAVITTV